MYSSIETKNFNPHFVMLSNKTKNNIMDNSDFYRIYYSDQLHNSNGIFLFFVLKDINISKYFNKLKCSFKKEKNLDIIKSFTMIERNILDLCPESKHGRSRPIYRIGEQLDNCFIKIFAESPTVSYGKTPEYNFLLKISGIWSNEKKHGLTFRFYVVNHQLRSV